MNKYILLSTLLLVSLATVTRLLIEEQAQANILYDLDDGVDHFS